MWGGAAPNPILAHALSDGGQVERLTGGRGPIHLPGAPRWLEADDEVAVEGARHPVQRLHAGPVVSPLQPGYCRRAGSDPAREPPLGDAESHPHSDNQTGAALAGEESLQGGPVHGIVGSLSHGLAMGTTDGLTGDLSEAIALPSYPPGGMVD